MKKKKISLKEQSPMGSFEYIRGLIRDVITDHSSFPTTGSKPFPYIHSTFLNHVIVEYGEKYYDVPFALSIDNLSVTLGEPKEVEQVFVMKEADIFPFKKDVGEGVRKDDPAPPGPAKSLDKELKEAGITDIKKEPKQIDLDMANFISLQEAEYDEESSTLEVVIVEQGYNSVKRRLYPDSTIREAAPLFSGLKMYINHPTKKEEMERPERNLKDWASTLVESHYEDGKAVGKVAIHDTWLQERLKDPVARAAIGLSINTGGKISYGKRNGETVQIVEKIDLVRQNGPASVDWVTEAGARGRVSRLLKESNTRGNNTMDIKEATFADLKRENPELVTSITESVKTSIQNDESTKKKDSDLKESQEKVAKFELKEKQTTQKDLVESILKEKKELTDPTKARIHDAMSAKLYESETELKEALAIAVKSELEYLGKFSTKGKIQTNANDEVHGGELQESALQTELDKRAGVYEEKKEDNK